MVLTTASGWIRLPDRLERKLAGLRGAQGQMANRRKEEEVAIRAQAEEASAARLVQAARQAWQARQVRQVQAARTSSAMALTTTAMPSQTTVAPYPPPGSTP